MPLISFTGRTKTTTPSYWNLGGQLEVRTVLNAIMYFIGIKNQAQQKPSLRSRMLHERPRARNGFYRGRQSADGPFALPARRRWLAIDPPSSHTNASRLRLILGLTSTWVGLYD
jgi:hypothetical protein